MNFIETDYQRRKVAVYQPIPGFWYSSLLGQLHLVRAVLYSGRKAKRVMIENSSGQRRSLSLAEWYGMDLALHSRSPERRRRRGRKDADETRF